MTRLGRFVMLPSSMERNRLEAFSDGVIAIIITIMVLEVKVPHGTSWSDLVPMLPTFLSYVLSFIYIGIYWTNHHHLFQTVRRINGPILWANLHLLFWLSLIPFVTAWAGENHFASVPIAAYGITFLLAGCAYTILVQLLIREHGRDSVLAKAMGSDTKGKISLVIYAIAIALSCRSPESSCALFVLVAIMWIIPDRRIERLINRK